MPNPSSVPSLKRPIQRNSHAKTHVSVIIIIVVYPRQYPCSVVKYIRDICLILLPMIHPSHALKPEIRKVVKTSQGSMSRLLILIMSSLKLAIHRHLSNAPSTGRKSYFALASMSLSRLLTMVAAVRKRSKLINGSLSRVLATTDGFCALYVRSWM